MSIISISGKKQSGKNTIAKIINQLTNNKYEEKCFADKLKDIICLLIGCFREQLEDESFKNKTMKDLYEENIISEDFYKSLSD